MRITRNTCCGIVADTNTLLRFLAAAVHIIIASAAAVAPSYIDALQHAMPVSSDIMLWNSKIYCSVPCEISA